MKESMAFIDSRRVCAKYMPPFAPDFGFIFMWMISRRTWPNPWLQNHADAAPLLQTVTSRILCCNSSSKSVSWRLTAVLCLRSGFTHDIQRITRIILSHFAFSLTTRLNPMDVAWQTVQKTLNCINQAKFA